MSEHRGRRTISRTVGIANHKVDVALEMEGDDQILVTIDGRDVLGIDEHGCIGTWNDNGEWQVLLPGEDTE